MSPSHGYVPRCHGSTMNPTLVMTDLNPEGERWWYCGTCGRVLKDVWN